MSYGIKIWSPFGQVWMDSSLTTWNLVESFEVPPETEVVKTYTALNDRSFKVLQIPLEVPFVEGYTYEKTIEVNPTSINPVTNTVYPFGTIKISGGNQRALVVVLCK